MNQDLFKSYLMTKYERQGGGHLPNDSAESYCDYVAGVEHILSIDLDFQDLSARGLALTINKYQEAESKSGTPIKTIGNRKTGLRAYARFRNGKS